MPREPLTLRAAAGFTLVELVLVIMIGSIMAVALAVFMRPAFESFLASRARAELASSATQALRRMQRDVRAAVPNSIRTPSASCFELVPTASGGRLRMDRPSAECDEE